MDIDLLRTFLEVSKTRHFGKAALNLFVTQSAVSSRIKLLEASLEIKLFDRTRNDIQLTQAGKKLLHQAELIVGLWDETKHSIVEADEEILTLFVSSISSLWDKLLVNWLKILKQQYPSIYFKGESLGVESQVKGLLARTLDIGFMFEPPQFPELVFKEMNMVELILVSSIKNQSLVEALDKGYIMVEWGTSFLVEHTRVFPNLAQPMIHLYFGRWAVDYLLLAGGSAYLARNMIEDHLEKKQLFRVNDAPVFYKQSFAVYNKKNKNINLIEKSLELFPVIDNE
ncbi:MAG: LysR family transcriptional regulator [Deltaproteobacteria bacterium]|nr:LysR family transcriptional regulator [Deltaproteobacteria bacterium]